MNRFQIPGLAVATVCALVLLACYVNVINGHVRRAEQRQAGQRAGVAVQQAVQQHAGPTAASPRPDSV